MGLPFQVQRGGRGSGIYKGGGRDRHKKGAGDWMNNRRSHLGCIMSRRVTGGTHLTRLFALRKRLCSRAVAVVEERGGGWRSETRRVGARGKIRDAGRPGIVVEIKGCRERREGRRECSDRAIFLPSAISKSNWTVWDKRRRKLTSKQHRTRDAQLPRERGR